VRVVHGAQDVPERVDHGSGDEALIAAGREGLVFVGADEVICWPTVAELDQVDRLAELVC
jgi:hypothetical protein